MPLDSPCTLARHKQELDLSVWISGLGALGALLGGLLLYCDNYNDGRVWRCLCLWDQWKNLLHIHDDRWSLSLLIDLRSFVISSDFIWCDEWINWCQDAHSRKAWCQVQSWSYSQNETESHHIVLSLEHDQWVPGIEWTFSSNFTNEAIEANIQRHSKEDQVF